MTSDFSNFVSIGKAQINDDEPSLISNLNLSNNDQLKPIATKNDNNKLQKGQQWRHAKPKLYQPDIYDDQIGPPSPSPYTDNNYQSQKHQNLKIN